MTTAQRIVIKLLTGNVRTLEGWDNLPAAAPYIVAANHVSYIEPGVISALVTKRTGKRAFSMSKEGIWQFFHKLHLDQFMGLVRVNPANKAASLEECLEKLQAGFAVIIFPEGTRNQKPELGPVKTGVARMALATGLPVVPVGYQGPRGMTTMESITNVYIKRLPLTVKVGTPLHFARVNNPTHEQLVGVTNTIMRAIAPLCDKTYNA